LMEVTLLSVRTSALLARQAAGSAGAVQLLEIKRSRLDDAIGAILVLNTLAITSGATLGGAQAARSFGELGVGVFSGVLTVLVLLVSEIIPKTLGARYAGRLSAFTGHVLSYLIGAMAPILAIDRAIIRLLARRPRERLTRHEFALLVGAAPEEGAISLGEARLIGSLIYSREILLKDVMTPHSMIFMMGTDQTVADLIAAPGVDAFSRIPLFEGDRRRITGYVSHREVLKSYALNHDGGQPLTSFRRPVPVFRDDDQAAKTFERLLSQHEAIAVVVNKRGEPIGLATLEDLLEAILGLEITDEADAIARLRPAISQSRKARAEQLQRMRTQQQAPPSNGRDPD
jgi:CBS domain containing-hemolysin-like protein